MQPNKPYPAKKVSKPLRGYEELPKIDNETTSEKIEASKQAMKSISKPITNEQIAKRAFEIWNERGQPLGCDLDHWLEAERELIGRN